MGSQPGVLLSQFRDGSKNDLNFSWSLIFQYVLPTVIYQGKITYSTGFSQASVSNVNVIAIDLPPGRLEAVVGGGERSGRAVASRVVAHASRVQQRQQRVQEKRVLQLVRRAEDEVAR